MRTSVINDIFGPFAEISTDGRTVWVNHVSGNAIGRFGPGGVDVHTKAGDGCLHCTHTKPTLEDWNTFGREMREYHNVAIMPHYRPDWLG